MITIGSIGDIFSILRRRALIMSVIVIAGAGLSYAYAKSRPHSYAASAVMQIESPRNFEDDSRGGGNRIASSYWLQLVQARLMVRDNILDLIEQFGLYADLPGLRTEQKIALFVNSVQIETITGNVTSFGAEQWPGVLRVSATMPTPEMAAGVANELAEKVLQLNASTQTERALETLRFYSEEEQRLLAQIERVEAEMAEFRNANLDYLPTALDNRPDELRVIETELAELGGELLEQRAKLAELANRAQLSAIEQRTQERVTNQIQVLMMREAQLRDRADAIRGSGQRTANAEAQMESYDRRLTLLRNQLSEAATRRANAETAQRMDEETRGDQFILLERAVPPEYPVQSARRKLMVMGLGASIMLALGVALALEMLRPVLRSAAQVQRASGLQPVITLPKLTRRTRS